MFEIFCDRTFHEQFMNLKSDIIESLRSNCNLISCKKKFSICSKSAVFYSISYGQNTLSPSLSLHSHYNDYIFIRSFIHSSIHSFTHPFIHSIILDIKTINEPIKIACINLAQKDSLWMQNKIRMIIYKISISFVRIPRQMCSIKIRKMNR